MINYGTGPASDEFEVTVFGPGYGEAIAVHLGEGNWLLVDSCIDPSTKLPASQTYLQHIQVVPEKVRAIIASHWHDDHVRGISGLAQTYPSAEFFVSGVFAKKEAAALLATYSGAVAPGQATGTKELYAVAKSRQVTPLLQRSSVLEVAASGKTIRVFALSPVPGAVMQSIAHLAQFLPQQPGVSPINHAPELSPNLEAVVIHIDLDGDAVLLGADLEEHGTLGWTAIASNQWCVSKTRSSVYKVAHHGSHTGDSPHIWATLLATERTACVTPFNRGEQKLPTDSDRLRIRSKSNQAYLSSGASKRPELDSAVLKRLGDICQDLSKVNAGFGAVRLRRRIANSTWSVELFGQACRL